MKPRAFLPRVSKKKLAASAGKPIYSTIASPRKAVRKSKRSKSERERIYGPKGYVEWIHEQPCVACGIAGHSECAHIKTGGTGRKANWRLTVPLCADWLGSVGRLGCHGIMHRMGRRVLEAAYGINLETEASETQIAWLSIKGEEK